MKRVRRPIPAPERRCPSRWRACLPPTFASSAPAPPALPPPRRPAATARPSSSSNRDRMGGASLHLGSVPSKALAAAAARAHAVRTAAAFGVDAGRAQGQFRPHPRPHPAGHRRARPAGLGRALRGAGRRGHQGRGQVRRPPDAQGRRPDDPRPPLHHRHRLEAGAVRYSRASRTSPLFTAETIFENTRSQATSCRRRRPARPRARPGLPPARLAT